MAPKRFDLDLEIGVDDRGSYEPIVVRVIEMRVEQAVRALEAVKDVAAELAASTNLTVFGLQHRKEWHGLLGAAIDWEAARIGRLSFRSLKPLENAVIAANMFFFGQALHGLVESVSPARANPANGESSKPAPTSEPTGTASPSNTSTAASSSKSGSPTDSTATSESTA